MLGGLAGALLEYVLYRLRVISFVSPMAANLAMAVWGLIAGIVVIVAATFLTRPPEPERLKGLIFERGQHREEEVIEPWYSRPAFYALIVGGIFIALNIVFF